MNKAGKNCNCTNVSRKHIIESGIRMKALLEILAVFDSIYATLKVPDRHSDTDFHSQRAVKNISFCFHTSTIYTYTCILVLLSLAQFQCISNYIKPLVYGTLTIEKVSNPLVIESPSLLIGNRNRIKRTLKISHKNHLFLCMHS